MPEPSDLKKAKSGTVVLLASKTWNLLVDIVTAGWPIAGAGIAIDQLPNGRSIRVKPTLGSDSDDSSSSSSSDSSSSSSDSSSSGSSDSSTSQPSEQSGSASSRSDSSSDSRSSGQSKDCVVPFRDGFIRWHCPERPDVVFEDVLNIDLDDAGNGEWTLEPEMIECCEPGSLQVTAICTKSPAACGAEIIGNKVFVRTISLGDPNTAATVTVEGVRRGFAGVKWEAADEAAAVANATIWELLNGTNISEV